ncbi:MAG: helix-turn-helix domain-containing protein [Prosthecobacter sp.]
MNSIITTTPLPQTSSTAAAAPGELLTQDQLAARLGISRRTLHTWIRHKTVPMIKVRGFCRFEYHKVLSALQQHERAVVPSSPLRAHASSHAEPPSLHLLTQPLKFSNPMNSNPNTSRPRPPLSQFVITGEELMRMSPEEIRRISGSHRRPVWRYWYDPYAGPPVAQTVAEALARAAKAPPGFIPEVEMLTPEEVDQRMEEIRNSPPRPSSRSQARRLKAARQKR